MTQQNKQPLPSGAEDTIERIKAMLEQARCSMVSNFAARLYFADGTSMQFVVGQSEEEEEEEEEERQVLALLRAKIAAGH